MKNINFNTKVEKLFEMSNRGLGIYNVKLERIIENRLGYHILIGYKNEGYVQTNINGRIIKIIDDKH